MIVATTLVALSLLAIALVARRLRSDLEESAWRLMSLTMLVTPLLPLLPKVDLGVRLPMVKSAPAGALPAGSTSPLLSIVYTLVMVALIARLVTSVLYASALRRHARRFSGVYLSPSLRVPVTAGLMRPAILLPADAPAWSEEKLAAVLAHERAHVARRDPLWRFIGRAAAAVSWYHPLAWLASAAIERIAEETADRQAITETGDRHQYADILLDLLRSMSGQHRRVLAAPMLDGRAVGARINAILQPEHHRRSPIVTRIVLAALVTGSVSVMGLTSPAAPAPERTNLQERPLTDAELRRQEELIRGRDEVRDRTRQELRETMQSLFRPPDSD